MKKIFLIFALLSICEASLFAGDYVEKGMYVNSREGLNIREIPSLEYNEPLGALMYGEFVRVVGEYYKVETIDGISSDWKKIIVDYNDEYGWVFSGYLQEKCPMSEEEIIVYLKRLNASDEDYFQTDYFPENPSIQYLRDSKKPNNAYFDDETQKKLVAVRDCLSYEVPGDRAYGCLRFVKKGTKFNVNGVADSRVWEKSTLMSSSSSSLQRQCT